MIDLAPRGFHADVASPLDGYPLRTPFPDGIIHIDGPPSFHHDM